MLDLVRFRLYLTNFFLRSTLLREENYVNISIIIKNTTPKPAVRKLIFPYLPSQHQNIFT